MNSRSISEKSSIKFGRALVRPRTLTDDQVAKVVERTLSPTPADATHWSLRSMARESGLSHTTIWRIWGAFGLQPHRSETFKLSGDPHFVDKVRDIVGLYLSPPDRALVLCVDLPSPKQGEIGIYIGHVSLISCFNPLPSPKQGEMNRNRLPLQLLIVSIRSPRRSKERCPHAFEALAQDVVSIRSPRRSKERSTQREHSLSVLTVSIRSPRRSKERS